MHDAKEQEYKCSVWSADALYNEVHSAARQNSRVLGHKCHYFLTDEMIMRLLMSYSLNTEMQ
jgi:hypothetical protein